MKKIVYLLTITALLSAVFISCKEKTDITGLKISKSTLSMIPNRTANLDASLLPYHATNKLEWTTSNENVVSITSVENKGKDVAVSKCEITAKGVGTAIITVSTKDGKNKAICTVDVINPEPELIKVEGGTFTMGDEDDVWAMPSHEVTISSFYVAKYPVTQQQWEALMGSNPSYTQGGKHPVERVSWEDATAFIKKLNAYTGKKYRLLTEAEWEYAARGGNQSQNYKYSGSDDVNAVAWYAENSDGKSQPVGTKAPNELGIYDMSGNVWEWCSDWADYYTSESQIDPPGPPTGTWHIIRGGGATSYAQLLRVFTRSYSMPSYTSPYIGFRLAHP